MNKQDLLLSPEQVLFELNCSKGVVDTHDKNIIQVSKDVADAASLHTARVIRDASKRAYYNGQIGNFFSELDTLIKELEGENV